MDFDVVKLHEKAIIPTKKDGDLGFDLHVVADDNFYNHSYPGQPNDKRCILGGFKRSIFRTGLKMAIPDGYGVVFRDRSGLAAKHGIHVLGGVIDSSYRGEWLICLLNTSNRPYQIIEGDRIAQAVVIPEFSLNFKEVNELNETYRGEKGFGSSGK